ncbi:unnamed protein product [Rotaria sordida]|uniref:Uncharacterized protein n=1 Tax=Rotaria sordida TaxID=392033 RepID=A0A819Q2N1_9BILA|nr:unnamed protein product [Rotaria sordida]CAF1036424.1 unnamed protein product [Rotaria sordida]CAF3986318.1 unnamed protein product [Rotaria sordida]CAF4021723.1 unnamed protein product [Rotaria sordida]
MQTTPSLEINHLLHKTDLLLLNNSETREFNEILFLFDRLKSVHEQINTLSITTPITSRSSLKTKSNKQINNSNSTKSSVPSILTQSYLLGNVDLDDEDDLLTKYQ